MQTACLVIPACEENGEILKNLKASNAETDLSTLRLILRRHLQKHGERINESSILIKFHSSPIQRSKAVRRQVAAKTTLLFLELHQQRQNTVSVQSC